MTDFDLGGGGGNAFSFGAQGSQPGASVSGTVLDMQEVQSTNFDTKKPEFWDDGRPKMQYRVTLQTQLRDPANPQDDGKRDIYLDGRRRPNDNGSKSRLCAVLDAVRAATGGTSLQYGGQLAIQWTSGMGFSGDPRNYQAWYTAPAMDLQQPAEHRAAPTQAAQPQPEFGSQAHQQQVAPSAPAWASQAGPPNPQITPPGQTVVPQQQPVQQQNPWDPQWPAQQQAPQPAAEQPQLPVAPPEPQQAAAPLAPTAAAGQAGQAITAEQVAAVKNLGVDPAQVFGPGYESRVVG